MDDNHLDLPEFIPATYVLRQGFVWVVSLFNAFRPEEGHVSEDHLILAHSKRLTEGYSRFGTPVCLREPTDWFGEFQEGVLVRVHSECLLSEVFGLELCDCREQLNAAMNAITTEGAGVIVYMRQEGRGIGLAAKLRTLNSRHSLDTYERNIMAGYPEDARKFDAAADALSRMNIRKIRLISDSPFKVSALLRCGIEVVRRIPLCYPLTPESARELLAKKRRGYDISYSEDILISTANAACSNGNHRSDI